MSASFFKKKFLSNPHKNGIRQQEREILSSTFLGKENVFQFPHFFCLFRKKKKLRQSIIHSIRNQHDNELHTHTSTPPSAHPKKHSRLHSPLLQVQQTPGFFFLVKKKPSLYPNQQEWDAKWKLSRNTYTTSDLARNFLQQHHGKTCKCKKKKCLSTPNQQGLGCKMEDHHLISTLPHVFVHVRHRVKRPVGTF